MSDATNRTSPPAGGGSCPGYEMYQQRDYKTAALGALLVVAVAIVLFQGSSDDFRGVDPKTGRTNLLVWQSYNGPEAVAFEEIARDFARENPDLAVRVAQIPWTGQESKYRTSLIAGKPPDVGRVDTTFLPELVQNGVVEDLFPYLAEEASRDTAAVEAAGGVTAAVELMLARYVPAAIESCLFRSPDGTLRVYGLPDQTNGACLFWNKAHFRDAGLDPERGPATWDEFLTMAVALTRDLDGDGKTDRYGFGMDNSLWWTFPFLNTHGARFLDETGTACVLDGPEAVAALQFKIDLFKKHKVEGGAWMSGGTNPEQGFTNAKYAMILMGPWKVKDFRQSQIDFGIGLIPAGPAGTATNVGGTNMVVFRKAPAKKAAYRFLRYLTSAKVQAGWAMKVDQIPVNLDAYASVDTSNLPHLAIFMEQMKTAVARPKVLKYGQLEEIINPLMETALKGDMTAGEALAKAVEKINREVLAKR